MVSDPTRVYRSESQRHGQRIVGRPGRRAREDGADRNGGPAKDQDKGPHELGYGGAQYVGGVYLAAVEPASARQLRLLWVIGKPVSRYGAAVPQ